MTKRKTYHVTKTKDGWQSKLEGEERASIKGENKADVIRRTVELTKNQDKASVRIHKDVEIFQEEII